MAKRKLSKQQARRVEKQRVRSSENLTNTLADQSDANVSLRQGCVITNFGKRVLIEDDSGEIANCAIRQHLGKLVAGDRVHWLTEKEEGKGIIQAVQTRETVLTRPGFRGATRMVAANISQLGIVMPVVPGVHPDMIDRYLVAATQVKLPAFIILNKIDLIEEQEHWEALNDLLDIYRELNVIVVAASSVTEHGLDDLVAQLRDQTSVLVGASGAGKSSLIKSLVPDIDIRIGALSEASGLGSHTTSNSILYHLPNGGDLIDSPGVRQFSPATCALNELEQCYADFAPFLGQCKFKNCTHTHEPKCAIQVAVDDGEIADCRLKSFHRLMQEFENPING